jgi:peptidoglycan/LPS O-acetylase OafA/YrhL
MKFWHIKQEFSDRIGPFGSGSGQVRCSIQGNKSSPVDYLAGVDGLRAIAVLAVIVYHIKFFSFLSGGFSGVDVFFVISGYVISKSLSKKFSLRFPSYLSEFYKRRVIRIIPALVVCLVVTTIVSTLFIPDGLGSTNEKTGLAAFGGVSNYALVRYNNGYFSTRVDFNPFLHTWSLAVEEQFYLFFPLLFYIWSKFGKERSVGGYLSRALLVGLAILSLTWAYSETLSNYDRAFYLLPSRFWELAAGALLFQLHSRNLCLANSKRISDIFLVSGVFLLGIGFVFSAQESFPFPWAIVPVLSTMLLISGVTNASDRLSIVHKFLQSSPIVYIGKISFSLYLWHWPVAALFRWTIGFDRVEHIVVYLTIVFLLAVASYHFVESPIRTNKYLLLQKNWKVILSGLVVVLTLYFISRHVFDSQSAISLSVTKDGYTWHAFAHTPREPGNVSTDEYAGRKLFAVGDSHAAAYRTMLKEISTQLGIEVYVYEQGDCSVANLLTPMSQTDACQAFYDHTFTEVKSLAEPNDIIFLASLRMPELSSRFEPFDEAAVIARINTEMTPENIQIALEDASRSIEEISVPGVHILIDAPKPVLKSPPYRCSDWFNKMNPICAPGLSVNREFLLSLRQPVMDSLQILESRHDNLFVWDPFFVLCEEGNCSAYDGDKPLFFDGDHLSAHGNRVLTPSFRNKLLDIWRQ